MAMPDPHRERDRQSKIRCFWAMLKFISQEVPLERATWCFSGPHRRSRAASSCTQMDNRRSRGTSSLPRCPMNTCFTSLNGLVAPLSLMCEDVPERQHSRYQPSRATSWVNNSPSRPPDALLGCYLSAGCSKKGKAVSLTGEIFSRSWAKQALSTPLEA